MGNSQSKKTLVMENDGLLAQLDNKDTQTECPTIIFRPAEDDSKSGKLLTPDEQLKVALAPFQRLLTLEPPPDTAPEEQMELLKCLKANEGNSLHCNKEIHDFVGFVNKLTLCTPSGQ